MTPAYDDHDGHDELAARVRAEVANARAKKRDGGPAFPLNASDSWGGPVQGMSYRAWVAGQVLARAPVSWSASDETLAAAAQCSVRMADALIAELAK